MISWILLQELKELILKRFDSPDQSISTQLSQITEIEDFARFSKKSKGSLTSSLHLHSDITNNLEESGGESIDIEINWFKDYLEINVKYTLDVQQTKLYWEEKKDHYSHIFSLCRKYFGIPLTTLFDEGTFSYAERLCGRGYTPEKLEEIIRYRRNVVNPDYILIQRLR